MDKTLGRNATVRKGKANQKLIYRISKVKINKQALKITTIICIILVAIVMCFNITVKKVGYVTDVSNGLVVVASSTYGFCEIVETDEYYRVGETVIVSFKGGSVTAIERVDD